MTHDDEKDAAIGRDWARTATANGSPSDEEKAQVAGEEEPNGQLNDSNNNNNNNNKTDKQDGPQELEPPRRANRKGSAVNFNDKCDLFEIDLECCPGGPSERPQKPPAVFSLRYYIMMLALVSPFIVTYSKTIINFAIIDMIDPQFLVQKHQPSSKHLVSAANVSQSEHYFELDNSCPVDESVKARLLSELESDQKRASESTGEKFAWDTDMQGLLKAAYSIGHIMLQVVGGRLSEIYGSQFIMSLSACLIALACLSAPFLASVHFYLLFADLFVLGLLGSFMTPSLITLFSNWLTPSEKSMFMSFYLVSSRLGYALSSLLCGLLISAQLSWRYLFYSAGWISLVFGNLFFLCSRNRPHEHPLMGEAELAYLSSKNTLVNEALARRKLTLSPAQEMKPVASSPEKKREKGPQEDPGQLRSTTRAGKGEQEGEVSMKQEPKSAPWAAILTSTPVWAFIITKFCVKLAGDTVQTELPVYLKRVMHMESKYNGLINSANYVIFCFSCLLVGMLANTANKRRPFGWTKTTVRKLFQCSASFCVSIVLMLVAFSVCEEKITLGLFMAFFIVSPLSTGGEAQIPLDLSERYAGTIHAIGSSLAISGAIEPIIVGQFTRGHGSDKDRWSNIWMGASAIAFMGGLVFLLFGEAKIQPFDKLDASEVDQSSDAKAKCHAQQTKKIGLKTSHDNKTFVGDDGKQLKSVQLQVVGEVEESNGQEEAPPYRESVQI